MFTNFNIFNSIKVIVLLEYIISVGSQSDVVEVVPMILILIVTIEPGLAVWIWIWILFQ